jgi:hypothetical protein
MQRVFLKILVFTLLTNLAAYGQSLGDIARENREKQNAASASVPPPVVITNKDLPRDPDADQSQSDGQPEAGAIPSKPANHRAAEANPAQQRVVQQWKKQILAQEAKIVDLQARIDQLNASIHAVNGSAQFEGPVNRYQARQLERAQEIQLQLDGQKRKLAEIQEEARHAGMHTTTYDP